MAFLRFSAILMLFLSITTQAENSHDPAPNNVSDCKPSTGYLLCHDAAEFRNADAFIFSNFSDNRFSELESAYQKWCTGEDRFPDGRWKIRAFRNGLYEFFSGSSPKANFSSIKEWQAQYPNSNAARLAEAIYWSNSAWRARGTGFSGSVTKEGRILFSERIGKSRDILNKVGERHFDCPLFYSLMIDLMVEQQEEWKSIKEIFERGRRKFPENHDIYFSAARAQSPRWGGSIEAYEAFARTSAAQTKSFEGMGMYARLYWIEDSEHGIPFSKDSKQPPLWRDLKEGYEDIIKRNPLSLHNTGRFASLACRAGDKEAYISLRRKFIGMEAEATGEGIAAECDQLFGLASSE